VNRCKKLEWGNKGQGKVVLRCIGNKVSRNQKRVEIVREKLERPKPSGWRSGVVKNLIVPKESRQGRVLYEVSTAM